MKEEKIDRIEEDLKRLREKCITAFLRMGINPETLSPENGLFKRTDSLEEEIVKIKKELEGNVTWPGVKKALITSSSVITALLFLFNILVILANHNGMF